MTRGKRHQPPNPRRSSSSHGSRSPQAQVKAKPTPTSSAHVASKKNKTKKGKGKGEGKTRGRGDKPPVEIWRRAPSKHEREQLPPFPTLNVDRMHIPTTADELAAARDALLAAPILGFDTESKPVFRKGGKDCGPHLVQLATSRDAYLLQIHHYPGAFALACEIMANEAITKVGFGLQNDCKTLPEKLGVELKNVVDFDERFCDLGFGKCLGVRGAIAVVLGQDFRKNKKLSMSNWAVREYTPSQVAYAANDAYTPALLWELMPEWETRQEPKEWWQAKIAKEAQEAKEAKEREEEAKAREDEANGTSKATEGAQANQETKAKPGPKGANAGSSKADRFERRKEKREAWKASRATSGAQPGPSRRSLADRISGTSLAERIQQR